MMVMLVPWEKPEILHVYFSQDSRCWVIYLKARAFRTIPFISICRNVKYRLNWVTLRISSKHTRAAPLILTLAASSHVSSASCNSQGWRSLSKSTSLHKLRLAKLTLLARRSWHSGLTTNAVGGTGGAGGTRGGSGTRGAGIQRPFSWK